MRMMLTKKNRKLSALTGLAIMVTVLLASSPFVEGKPEAQPLPNPDAQPDPRPKAQDPNGEYNYEDYGVYGNFEGDFYGKLKSINTYALQCLFFKDGSALVFNFRND